MRSATSPASGVSSVASPRDTRCRAMAFTMRLAVMGSSASMRALRSGMELTPGQGDMEEFLWQPRLLTQGFQRGAKIWWGVTPRSGKAIENNIDALRVLQLVEHSQRLEEQRPGSFIVSLVLGNPRKLVVGARGRVLVAHPLHNVQGFAIPLLGGGEIAMLLG